MYSSTIFWLSLAACFVLAVGAGWFAHRLLNPSEKRQRELERQLQDARQSLEQYRGEVNQHFRGTAERVNRLTENYRELHQHLSDGALGLCADTPDSEQLLLTSLGDGSNRHANAATSPPLDYAPRSSAQQPGILNEDYELERSRED